MQTKLYLDIETIPADIENENIKAKLEYLYARKVEKVHKKNEILGEEDLEKGLESFEDFWKQTSFDGAFGRVLCIVVGINDEEVKCLCNPEDEAKTLRDFWAGVSRYWRPGFVVKWDPAPLLFIGHNIIDFDMRFLIQRSRILGVQIPIDISFARYRSDPMYDTMHEWVKWGSGKVGLEHIALALGIPTPKEGIDGSEVYNFYKRGEIDAICEYCKRDVETTRAVYKKMEFLD